MFILLIYVIASPHYDDIDILYFCSNVNARGQVEKVNFVKNLQKMLGIDV